MILGIGIDIVKVARFDRWRALPGMVDRFFHPSEIDRASRHGYGGSLSLAARFAAKEAFGKALGSGLSGFALRDVQVVNDETGRPFFRLHGSALRRFESFGARRVHLSLTHEDDNAVAMVVIEG